MVLWRLSLISSKVSPVVIGLPPPDRDIDIVWVDLGYQAYASSSAEFSKLIADDTEKWGKLIRAANIRPD
jgi:hypothetical protein